MKTVFVLFDSLNRRALECYGGRAVKTPNFLRFAERAVTFDNHYVGSLPCMPARRDLHTGRLNFLHRSWGPLEPFDNSYPEILKGRGVYSHLITDHYHYFEDGGATYHTRYSSWEGVRGQEWDPWKGVVAPDLRRFRETYHDAQVDEPGAGRRHRNLVNREFLRQENDFPLVRCYEKALDFLARNQAEGDWLLNLETFDPHEPFHAPARFRQDYPTGYQGPILDWPRYRRVEESAEEIAELQANYAALVSMCDAYFGRLLDFFDANGLWEDTALIVATDHGFLLGEHDWWGKSRMPFYDEIAHIPLMIYHPDFARHGGERRQSLTQTIDLMPTLLEMHGVERPDEVEGVSLLSMLDHDEPVRDAAIFGQFGSATNVTDGRYAYFRYPQDIFDQELYEYTLMPTHQACLFELKEFEGASLAPPFPFTKGLPLLKLPGRRDAKRPPVQGGGLADATTVLYDLETDPGQTSPLEVPDIEARLIGQMTALMRRHDAPPEAYRRLGLPVPE